MRSLKNLVENNYVHGERFQQQHAPRRVPDHSVHKQHLQRLEDHQIPKF